MVMVAARATKGEPAMLQTRAIARILLKKPTEAIFILNFRGVGKKNSNSLHYSLWHDIDTMLGSIVDNIICIAQILSFRTKICSTRTLERNFPF
jgi:hypothetical protein